MSRGCEVFLDPAQSLMLVSFLTDEEGRFLTTLRLGADPGLCGLRYVLQGVVLDPVGGPLGFGQLSSAVEVRLGE